MPALEIIALDTTTPQLRAPSAADTYTAPRAMDITPVALTGSSATSSLSIAQTWNTTGTPTAISLNVTDTASNASSLLMDLRVGGSSRFALRKDGQATFGGIGLNVPGNVGLSLGTDLATIRFGAAGDLFLARDAANTLALRNGVNAQAFNIYNTYTDASNYERGFVGWMGSEFRIAAERAGTGGSRGIRINSFFYINLEVAGVDRLGITSSLINANVPIEFVEQTAPAAPATNRVRIFAQDNGAGKTQLMALFATGAAQQIAIEP